MKHLDSIHEKIYDQKRLGQAIARWRLKSDRIVFTNGCFDILHRGHVEYLSQAADLGHRLVVGLNSDSSVKRLKGDSRPVQDEQSRSIVLAAQCIIDGIVIFSGDTPLELIQSIEPDVLVKGGDYDPEIDDPSNDRYIVGSDIVRSYGGEVITIPLVDGYSTSNIVSRMNA